MAERVILLADPGIDGAFAIALALLDPRLEVLALAATAGNVPAEQATRNMHIILDQCDPPRWPRMGSSPPITYENDATNLHGAGGLGGLDLPVVKLHHPHPSDKVIVDQVRLFPKDVTIIAIGPLTTLALALDRDPELPELVHRMVILGGTLQEAGDAGPVSEFHFASDPAAARQVLRCGAPITLIPLDVSRKLLLSPKHLLELPAPESQTCKFLRQIVPFGIRAMSNHWGIEGFYLQDVVGVVSVALNGSLTTRPALVDVETRGELTRGMSVVDNRPQSKEKSNVELAVGIDVPAARGYLRQVLGEAG
jgi:inosine-uridine nucleoside N-ribohydrolase